jgi:hypothetical protein
MPMLKLLATKRANYSISWILCAILFALPAMARGQSESPTVTQPRSEKNAWLRLFNNGAWWNTLSPDSKSDFVDGYVSAMATVHQTLIGIIKQDKNKLTPGPTFDSEMSRLIQLSVIAERGIVDASHSESTTTEKQLQIPSLFVFPATTEGPLRPFSCTKSA